MREKVERGGRKGWEEGEVRTQRRKGFVHRLDQETTSFFFTNFPDDAKVTELWSKFARHGRVGEVYVPKKLDKQGRRFGFVKFREVRDGGEMLSRLGDIWLGTYKLRVNLSRFNREDNREEVREEVPESSMAAEARHHPGRSFKEAVVADVAHRSLVEVPKLNAGQNLTEVVWEVEVEPESVAKLKGAFVGFLAEYKETLEIQQKLVLDGFQKIKVSPLGHLRVLLSSDVEGEVKDLVRTVGWWSTWFDRFEEWSPEHVSNHRAIWLRCFGVPLHAWGDALFRSVAFKYGVFIEVDSSTKNMLRGDMARIKIVTKKLTLIDSSMTISVLGKNFVIRVMEEGGVGNEEVVSCSCRCKLWRDVVSSRGSADGGSVAAVVAGSVDEGSDDGWSENGQVLLGVGRQEG
ncbi:endonuclease/exonuclease/phosphatase family protein, partial [Trifolium medium]|nr:endonuclease/exonuclease/phosphatase family protein [Trifolium medium]